MSRASSSLPPTMYGDGAPPQRIPRLEQVRPEAIPPPPARAEVFTIESDSDEAEVTPSSRGRLSPCAPRTQTSSASHPSPLLIERSPGSVLFASTETSHAPVVVTRSGSLGTVTTPASSKSQHELSPHVEVMTIPTSETTVTAESAMHSPAPHRDRQTQGQFDSEPSASPARATKQTEAQLSPPVHPNPRCSGEHAAEVTAGTSASSSDGDDLDVAEPPPALSDEQLRTMALVVEHGRSVFVTGGAGTGKSFLLRKIITALPRSTTFVTATTGIAALNLGGTTLHSFAGCGLVERGADRREVFSRVRGRTKVRKNWQSCQVLIIDEVSMLDPWFFDVLDYVARRIRNNPDAPFGGIQLVLSGDFLQLPPVIKPGRTQPARRNGAPQPNHNQLFCFESDSWLAVNPAICLLTKAFRQKDRKFFQMLSEMRMGVVSSMTLTRLQALSSVTTVNFVAHVSQESSARTGDGGGTGLRLAHEDGSLQQSHFDGYTILRPKRDEVERENNFYYAQLTTEEVMYQGIHTGQGHFDEKALPKLVRVRQGCRVMLIKNFDASLGLVNGSTGTVTNFIDASKGYRTRNESITPYDVASIGVGRGQDRSKRHMLLPVVAFAVRQRDGSMGTREVVVEPQEWKEMQGDTCLSRTVQMPLILAYAITIHKSQGMSLTHVDIDFRNTFETGQAYVALSRCTDLEHTRLHSFGALAVQPNPIALSYYKALEHFLAARQWRRQHPSPSTLDARGVSNLSYTDDRATSVDRDADKGQRSIDDGGDDDDDNGAVGSFTPYGYLTPMRAGTLNLTAYGDDEEAVSAAVVLTPVQSPTMQIEALRKRILPATQQADKVQQIVRGQIVSAGWVRGGRLIMDITAFFDLITGEQSAAQYQKIFEANGNAMRVPLTVLQKLSEVAAYKLSQSADPVTEAAAEVDEEEDELLQASNVAAEALRLIEVAKGDFAVDVQRDGESVPLPPCQPSWMQFADALPLLRAAAATTSTGNASGENLDELSFLLNRDPREVPQHAEILQYALFLRERFGSQNFVLCTNSPTLAAYGLAYKFKVAHIAADGQ